MDNLKNITNKKTYIYIGLSILFIIFIQILWSFLHTGRIIINTDSTSNSITLVEVNSKGIIGTTQTNIKTEGKLKASLPLGHYLVTVNNNNKTSTQLINLGSNKTLTYNISLSNTISTEPVINTSAQDIAASNNIFSYLNVETNNLNSIDTNNNLSVVKPSNYFQTISWANVSYGVGQTSDQKLYTVDGNSVSNIILPFNTTSKNIGYAVANNKQIYISSGSDVYSDINNKFSKLFTASSPNLVLGASVNKVAIAYLPSNNLNNANTLLSVVDTSGKIHSTNILGPVSALSWSPNSLYLAVINRSSINILNKSLKTLVVIPTTLPANNIAWEGSSSFIYTDNGNIWSFNVNTSGAHIIADIKTPYVVSGLAVSDDRSYIYISTTNTISKSNSAIFRISLNGQVAPTLVYQLQDILPLTLSDSTISLINFGKPPSLIITPLFPRDNLNSGSLIQEAKF
jgi:hypothetical protein